MHFYKMQISKTINFQNFSPGYEYGANLMANRGRCKRNYFTTCKGILYKKRDRPTWPVSYFNWNKDTT